MSENTDAYYLELLRRHVWPTLTKRQKRRILRIDLMLWAIISGLGKEPTPRPGEQESS